MSVVRHNASQLSELNRASIEAMLSLGHNNKQIGKALKVSENTVAAVIRTRNDRPTPLVGALKKNLGDKFAVVADNALNAITPEKLLKSSAAQLSIIAATAVDKMLLLDGKPTQIHAVALFQQVQDDQAALRKELAGLQNALDITPAGL